MDNLLRARRMAAAGFEHGEVVKEIHVRRTAIADQPECVVGGPPAHRDEEAERRAAASSTDAPFSRDWRLHMPFDISQVRAEPELRKRERMRQDVRGDPIARVGGCAALLRTGGADDGVDVPDVAKRVSAVDNAPHAALKRELMNRDEQSVGSARRLEQLGGLRRRGGERLLDDEVRAECERLAARGRRACRGASRCERRRRRPFPER